MLHLFRKWQSARWTRRLLIYMVGLHRAHKCYDEALSHPSNLEFMTPEEIAIRREGADKAFWYLMDRSVHLVTKQEIHAYLADIRVYVDDPWAYCLQIPALRPAQG